MHHELCSHLFLDSSGTTSEVSQAVSTEGANTAQWEAVLYNLTATNVSFQLQGSNDLENWGNIGTAQTQTSAGFKLFTEEGCATAYVRVKYTITATGTATVCCTCCMTNQ